MGVHGQSRACRGVFFGNLVGGGEKEGREGGCGLSFGHAQDRRESLSLMVQQAAELLGIYLRVVHQVSQQTRFERAVVWDCQGFLVFYEMVLRRGNRDVRCDPVLWPGS